MFPFQPAKVLQINVADEAGTSGKHSSARRPAVELHTTMPKPSKSGLSGGDRAKWLKLMTMPVLGVPPAPDKAHTPMSLPGWAGLLVMVLWVMVTFLAPCMMMASVLLPWLLSPEP